MRHEITDLNISGHEVTLFTESNPESVLIQPVDSHDMEEMSKEIEYIEHHCNHNFVLAAVKINKWNEELTPWPAPPVFGKIPFGDGAGKTLCFITENLLPWFKTKLDRKVSVFLGGYSLAGLFSLWACYNTDVFDGVVAASPSVWYNDWLDYSRQNKCKTAKVYLSLGDMEWHSKNKLMATVAEAIKQQKIILDEQGVANALVWNPGNHFTDNGVRTAKGFVWVG